MSPETRALLDNVEWETLGRTCIEPDILLLSQVVVQRDAPPYISRRSVPHRHDPRRPRHTCTHETPLDAVHMIQERK